MSNATATSAAFIYLDLDDFKRVNDQHGHVAGDAVLKAVAMVLARHVRASDLAARIGGDEFALLLWQCSEADARPRPWRWKPRSSERRRPWGQQPLGRRLGRRRDAASARPAADVVGRADRAMYARKKQARPAEAAE